MLEIIKDIIVKWDPIGLMEYAPPDEYDNECHLILEALIKKQASLGKIIYDASCKCAVSVLFLLFHF